MLQTTVSESKKPSGANRFRRLLKIIAALVIGVLALLFIVFKTPFFLADIRPASLKGGYVLQNNGAGFLEQAQQAHGMEAWAVADSLRYLVQHQFNGGRVSFLVSPTGEERLEYELVSFPQGGSSLYRSTRPETGFFLGQDEQGIFQRSQGQRTDGGFSNTFFYLAIEHLIEFPFRMQSATILEHIGQQTWGGKEYDLVFATWNDFEPTHEMDQYIIWINKESGLIERFDATGRQILPFARASATFMYEANGEAIKTPSIIRVNRGGPDGTLIMDLHVTKKPD